jgi:hypothetical protein
MCWAQVKDSTDTHDIETALRLPLRKLYGDIGGAQSASGVASSDSAYEETSTNEKPRLSGAYTTGIPLILDSELHLAILLTIRVSFASLY